MIFILAFFTVWHDMNQEPVLYADCGTHQEIVKVGQDMACGKALYWIDGRSVDWRTYGFHEAINEQIRNGIFRNTTIRPASR